MHDWGDAMRAVDFAKIAAEAELVRVRHMLKRQGMRVAFAAGAAVFAIGVLVLANIAVWQVVRLHLDPIYASLILLGGNLVLALIFGGLAMRSTPSHTEREALDVRKQALTQLQQSVAIGTLIPIAGTLLGMSSRKPKSSSVLGRIFARP